MSGDQNLFAEFEAALEAEGRELDQAERDVAAKRERWFIKVKGCVEFRTSKNMPVPPWANGHDKAAEKPRDEPPANNDPWVRTYRIKKPRIGEVRSKVLAIVARQTLAGRPANATEIAEETGLDHVIVANVIWRDAKEDRGVLERVDKDAHHGRGKFVQVKLTERGFELLRRTKVLDADAAKV
jgi:hypothetical protein